MNRKSPVVVVNARKMPLEKTLGVALYVLRLADALAKKIPVYVAVSDPSSAQSSPYAELLRTGGVRLLSLDSVPGLLKDHVVVELCPHHFQPPEFSKLSVLICHDLHVFDVPWKYPDVEKVQGEFRSNLEAASVVVSEFPRTYYEVERRIERAIRDLFLIDSPLLLDTGVAAATDPIDPPMILYPAQLQRHKNHLGLLKGFKLYRKRGGNGVLRLTGTEFGPSESREIVDYIEQEGLLGSVDMVGRLSNEDMIRSYGEATATIITSVAEGGAYVALESVMANRPVAVNAIPAAKAHLDQYAVQCELFDANDPEAVARTLKMLVGIDREEFASRNSEARARIQSTTWESAAEKMMALVSYLVGEGPKPMMLCDSVSWNNSYQFSR